MMNNIQILYLTPIAVCQVPLDVLPGQSEASTRKVDQPHRSSVTRKGHLLLPRHFAPELTFGSHRKLSMSISDLSSLAPPLTFILSFCEEPTLDKITIRRFKVFSRLINLKILLYRLNLNYKTHQFEFNCVIPESISAPKYIHLTLIAQTPWPEYINANRSPTFWDKISTERDSFVQ